MRHEEVRAIAREEAALAVLKAIRGLLEELRNEVEKERLPFGAGARVDALLTRVRLRYGEGPRT